MNKMTRLSMEIIGAVRSLNRKKYRENALKYDIRPEYLLPTDYRGYALLREGFNDYQWEEVTKEMERLKTEPKQKSYTHE